MSHIFSELEEIARQNYEKRIADRRAETNCYNNDGLYEIIFQLNSDVAIILKFVDDSSVLITRNSMIHGFAKVENVGVTPLNLMSKFLKNGSGNGLKIFWLI